MRLVVAVVLAVALPAFAYQSPRVDRRDTKHLGRERDLSPAIPVVHDQDLHVVRHTESTYDWENSKWTIPLNASVSQLLKIAGQPVSFQVGPKWYAEGPTAAPDWGLRFAVTLLFPK